MNSSRLNEAADVFLPEIGEDGHHTRQLSGHLRRYLDEEVTDLFLELLLHAMAVAFVFSRDYRRHIEGYRATLEFCAGARDAADEDVIRTVVEFEGEHMHVNPDHEVPIDTKVRFTSARALRDFLLSKDHDIIGALLNAEVDVRGNMNHVYRFGFLAADLIERLP